MFATFGSKYFTVWQLPAAAAAQGLNFGNFTGLQPHVFHRHCLHGCFQLDSYKLIKKFNDVQC